MAVVNPEVEQLARRVAEKFQPEKVILFGSHATGAGDAGSDVDLVVIMDCPGRPVDQAVAIRQFLRWPHPLDLLVRTLAEVRHRLARGDRFLQEIMEQGVVLYERSHTRVGG